MTGAQWNNWGCREFLLARTVERWTEGAKVRRKRSWQLEADFAVGPLIEELLADEPGLTTLFDDREPGACRLLVGAEDGVLVLLYASGHLSGVVYGREAGPCDALLDRLAELVPEGANRETVPADFWFQTGKGPEFRRRELVCPNWSEIAGNYPRVRDQLEELMALRSPWERGRLVFWSGPPGTGKTTALRALLGAWSGARATVITDPEKFLGDVGYLYHVVLDEEAEAAPFRLIVLEDAPDLVLASDRKAKWHLTSRLLNLTDGLIGQGLRLVVLVTTNEQIEAIDPAFTRPGRAIQVLRFPPLDADEAAAWLAARGERGDAPTGPLTLAELYGWPDSGRARAPVHRRSLGFGATG